MRAVRKNSLVKDVQFEKQKNFLGTTASEIIFFTRILSKKIEYQENIFLILFSRVENFLRISARLQNV